MFQLKGVLPNRLWYLFDKEECFRGRDMRLCDATAVRRLLQLTHCVLSTARCVAALIAARDRLSETYPLVDDTDTDSPRRVTASQVVHLLIHSPAR